MDVEWVMQMVWAFIQLPAELSQNPPVGCANLHCCQIWTRLEPLQRKHLWNGWGRGNNTYFATSIHLDEAHRNDIPLRHQFFIHFWGLNFGTFAPHKPAFSCHPRTMCTIGRCSWYNFAGACPFVGEVSLHVTEPSNSTKLRMLVFFRPAAGTSSIAVVCGGERATKNMTPSQENSWGHHWTQKCLRPIICSCLENNYKADFLFQEY